MFVTQHPGPALAAFVDTIWFASRGPLPHERERVLPTGRVDIVIPLLQDGVVRYDSADSAQAQHLRGAVVIGAHDRPMVRGGLAGASSVIGVHFRAGGAAALFGAGVRELFNCTVELEALWGPAAHELRERLQLAPTLSSKFRIVEDALLSRLASPRPADRMVAWALQRLEQDPFAARIEAVQRNADCSPAQFTRRFEAAVGITPKRYARVLRFGAMLPAVARAGPRDWAEVAVQGGYFDQSHLIHEFKRLAGVTPRAYAPLSADRPTHVPVAAAQPLSPARKNLQYMRRAGG